MKFDHLMEYNMRNTILENSYTKCDGETGPRPFCEKIKLRISLDRQCEVLSTFLLLYVQVEVEVYQNILKLLTTYFKIFLT